MLNMILSEATNIFDNYTLPVGEGGVNWDLKKLDDFLNILYQLLDQGSCVSACLSIGLSVCLSVVTCLSFLTGVSASTAPSAGHAPCFSLVLPQCDGCD